MGREAGSVLADTDRSRWTVGVSWAFNQPDCRPWAKNTAEGADALPPLLSWLWEGIWPWGKLGWSSSAIPCVLCGMGLSTATAYNKKAVCSPGTWQSRWNSKPAESRKAFPFWNSAPGSVCLLMSLSKARWVAFDEKRVSLLCAQKSCSLGTPLPLPLMSRFQCLVIFKPV